MKAKEVKRNVMKGLCLIAVLSAILLFYQVVYDNLSYTKAHLIDLFTLPIPFLDAFGESWREEYLPSDKQVGKFRYKAYWNARGTITVLVRECGHDKIIYCSSCHPAKALGIIENLNQGELPADFGKNPVKVPEENLELIDALR